MNNVMKMLSGLRTAANGLSAQSRQLSFRKPSVTFLQGLATFTPTTRCTCLKLAQKTCVSFATVNTSSLVYVTESKTLVLPRLYSTQMPGDKIPPAQEKLPNEVSDTEPKLSLFQKFKKMYKEYWYVLIPVHCATSVVWFGSFYYLAVSGVDIVPLLETLGASESIIKTISSTGAGYIAVAYGMYKIATPARYTVTLGGTTISINYLRKWGYIKPIPSREKMTEMIKEKGIELKSRRAKILAKMNLRRKTSNQK